MSPDLRKFLTDWLAWVDADMPPHPIFRPYFGLCPLARQTGGPRLHKELTARLGRSLFPFGGAVRYATEVRDGTVPFNPARLLWVREVLS